MSDHGNNGSGAVPPHAQLIQMGTGQWVSRIVYVAAQLELADHLASGPKSAADLAGATRTHARSLHRLMRTLASFGVLSEGDDSRFALTPLGEALKTGAPGSARATILSMAGQWMWRAWEDFPYSVATGKTAMEKAWGMPIFDFMAKEPQEAALFNEAMIGIHGAEPPAVAEAYDFSKFDTVVDVGGATGNLISAILARHARPHGILFDMPHVVREAPALLKAKGVGDRVVIESGSFFETVPKGGDAYVLSHIIHDWNEDQCQTILGHVRKAMKPNGRLLIVEMVLPPGNEPHPGKIFDIVMLVFPGGQERTEAEYRELLSRAGFRLTRVVPTQSAVSVVEAEVA
jgi:O-methyltransferase/methyltransferase family protein